MKPLRLILIVLGSLVLLLAVGAVLALSPSVQTWAAHRFAPASPELTVSLGRIASGLHSTRVDNLRVVQPGLVLTVPSAEIEMSAIAAAGGKVAIKSLVAHGWLLDLTAPRAPDDRLPITSTPTAPSATTQTTASNSAAAPRPLTAEQHAHATFEGLLARINLPVDLAIDGVDLSGDVRLPGGLVHVVISGGGLAAGQEGKWVLTADAIGPEATKLSVRGNLAAHLATARAFDRIELTLNAAASGPKIPSEANLSLNLRAAQDSQGETYVAALSSGARELLKVDIGLPKVAAPLSGSWKLDLTTADAAPFALGHTLPDFAAKGQGSFSAELSGSQVKATGSLEAWVDRLGQVRPELTALGRLGFVADFDLATQDQMVRLNRCDLSMISGATSLASVAALQPIEFNRTSGALAPATGTTELMRIEINGIPLSWVQPMLGDLVLAGQDLRGAFTVSAHNGGVTVRSSTPLTLLGLGVAQAGQPLVQGLDVSLSVQADYSPQGWLAEVSQLTITQARSPLLKLTAKATQPSGAQQPLAASGTYELVLPALLGQPLAAGKVALAHGLAKGDFSASVGVTQTASLTVQLTDLIAANPAATRLPSVVLLARADVDEAGRINIQVPIVLTQDQRRSDLNLAGVVAPTTGTQTISAQITAHTLQLADLLSFTALSVPSNSQPAAPQPAPPPAPRPTDPLWAGAGGDLKIDINTLVYSKELQINEIKGALKLTPAAATLEGFRATVSSGGRLEATGELQFDAQQAQPYALKADLLFADLDSAPLLHALAPSRPSPIEGKFNLTTQLTGRAVDPAGFSDTVIGDITLNSKRGTLRALSVQTGSNADTVGKVAALAGLFGTLTGSDVAVKQAEKVRATAAVTKQLSAITYNQLNIVVGRDAQQNLAVKDLTLTSPQLRLAGTGKITNQPGLPLIQQPLLLVLKLEAHEPFTSSLRTLKLVNDTTDAQGYTALVDDVIIDGSLQSLGTTQLKRLINRAIGD